MSGRNKLLSQTCIIIFSNLYDILQKTFEKVYLFKCNCRMSKVKVADKTETAAMKYKKKPLHGHKHLDKVKRKDGTTLSTVPDIQTKTNKYSLY